jgi:bacterioferritin-associated ferredoxin
VVICHCHAVNDRRIRDEIASGAIDADALAERCGAGTRCGSCVPVVEAILATASASVEAFVGIRRPAYATTG